MFYSPIYLKRGRTTSPPPARRVSTLSWLPNLSLRYGKAAPYLMHVMYCVAKTLHLSARLPDEVFTASGALRQGVLDLLLSLLVHPAPEIAAPVLGQVRGDVPLRLRDGRRNLLVVVRGGDLALCLVFGKLFARLDYPLALGVLFGEQLVLLVRDLRLARHPACQ